MAQFEELSRCYSPALIYDSEEQLIIHKAAECALWESGTFTINDQETGPLADGPLHHRDTRGTAGKFKVVEKLGNRDRSDGKSRRQAEVMRQANARKFNFTERKE